MTVDTHVNSRIFETKNLTAIIRGYHQLYAMRVENGIYHGQRKITCKTAVNIECWWPKFFEKNLLACRITDYIKSDGVHSRIAQRVVRKYNNPNLSYINAIIEYDQIYCKNIL